MFIIVFLYMTTFYLLICKRSGQRSVVCICRCPTVDELTRELLGGLHFGYSFRLTQKAVGHIKKRYLNRNPGLEIFTYLTYLWCVCMFSLLIEHLPGRLVP